METDMSSGINSAAIDLAGVIPFIGPLPLNPDLDTIDCVTGDGTLTVSAVDAAVAGDCPCP